MATRKVDWDYFEERLSDEYRRRSPFVVVGDMQSLYEFANFEAENQELTDREIIKKYLEKEMELPTVNILNLSKAIKREEFVEMNKEVELFFHFAEISNVDVFVKTFPKEGKSIVVNVMRKLRTNTSEDNAKALQLLQELNLNVGMLEIQEVFNKEIDFTQKIITEQLKKWVLDNIKWNFKGFKKLFQEVEQQAMEIIDEGRIYYELEIK